MLYKILESIKSAQMLDNLMQGDLYSGFLAEQALLYLEIETIIYTCIHVYVYLLTYFGAQGMWQLVPYRWQIGSKRPVGEHTYRLCLVLMENIKSRPVEYLKNSYRDLITLKPL